MAGVHVVKARHGIADRSGEGHVVFKAALALEFLLLAEVIVVVSLRQVNRVLLRPYDMDLPNQRRGLLEQISKSL